MARRLREQQRYLLQAENPYHPALARVPAEFGYKVGWRPHIGWVVGAYVTRQEKPVTADSSKDCYVLPAVRSKVRDGTTDHARSHFELPQGFPGSCIRRFEPA